MKYDLELERIVNNRAIRGYKPVMVADSSMCPEDDMERIAKGIIEIIEESGYVLYGNTPQIEKIEYNGRKFLALYVRPEFVLDAVEIADAYRQERRSGIPHPDLPKESGTETRIIRKIGTKQKDLD